MKRVVFITILMVCAMMPKADAQSAEHADIYLLTCAPGAESYSIYGHTALRIVLRETSFDMVYNWGIFDFSTPNFEYRFAKGKLDYLLGAYPYQRFLEEYISEGRAVWSQKLNLTAEEKIKLFELIDDNLKPENIRYRYDFFFDNCATRVRDIIAASATEGVLFPEREREKSFRQLIDPYQKVLPWLDFGADMLLGLQADRKATAEDEMFLPIYLRDNFTDSKIIHNGIPQSLTEPVETVVDFPDTVRVRGAWVPQSVMWLLFLFVLLVTLIFKRPRFERAIDMVLFFVFSLLALLLLFTNIFSEHHALHFNLLFIAVNLFIPVIFIMLSTGRSVVKISRITLALSALWVPLSLIAGQGINPALIPMVLVIMVRLYSHCGFGRQL